MKHQLTQHKYFGQCLKIGSRVAGIWLAILQHVFIAHLLIPHNIKNHDLLTSRLQIFMLMIIQWYTSDLISII